MIKLGPLEQQVMEVLWTSCENNDLPLTVRAVADELPESAYTTVATVLGNLMNKQMVEQFRSGRRLLYRPRRTRALYAADQMIEALGTSRRADRTLRQFLADLTPDQRATLHEVLAETVDEPPLEHSA